MAGQIFRWRLYLRAWISAHRWMSVIAAAAAYAVIVGLIPGLLQGQKLTQILIAMGSWDALGLIVFGVLFRPRGGGRAKDEPQRATKRSMQSREPKKSRRRSRGSRRH